MHIDVVPNRNAKPTYLLREAYREGKKVKKRTLANLSSLSLAQIDALRLVLKGEQLAPVGELFEKLSSKQHGNVDAVLTVMRRLGFDKLIAARPSKQRDTIIAAVASLILEPDSKLGMTRWWQDTTLPSILGVDEVDEDGVYDAMDWLLKRQGRIEKKLAARHLAEGDLVLYDLTSSYFEGTTCPLARLGHNRDKKKGKLQVNYGVLADRRGCPVSVAVFEGNTGDPTTVMPQVAKLREEFAIKQLVLVGDRGMLSRKQLDAVRDIEGIDWITALKSCSIRTLIEGGVLQLGLFDERNIFELAHPDYPGERLVACRNPELAKLRAHKRHSLLAATAKELNKVRGMAGRSKLVGQDKIGVRVGKVVNKYKMAKHFKLDIRDDGFDFMLDDQSVANEAALDGIYIVRTSLPQDQITPADTVRCYKALANVERAFRSLKSIDLLVRPIRHRTEERVRAHLFLCMLAFYVQWHMVEAWRPLLFADEDQQAKRHRDPVAAAKRSPAAMRKTRTKRLVDGSDVHSFRTLLKHMGSITRDLCRRQLGDDDTTLTFSLDTRPNEKQQRALDLLRQISV